MLWRPDQAPEREGHPSAAKRSTRASRTCWVVASCPPGGVGTVTADFDTYDPNLEAGSWDNYGTVTKGSGTISIKTKGWPSGIFDSTGIQDLGNIVIAVGVANTSATMGSNLVVTTLTVNASQTFSMNGSNTLTLSGSGTPPL